MTLPWRASDGGPEPTPEPTDPLECVSLAVEYLDLYRANRQKALQNTPRRMWLCHLQEAIRLLDRAESLEIDGC